jgi:signal transduction histidine kinase
LSGAFAFAAPPRRAAGKRLIGSVNPIVSSVNQTRCGSNPDKAMFREKLISTLVVASAIVCAAMAADYVITIVILNDHAGYTPLVTLSIGTLVSFPTTYAFVSSRINLRLARDAHAEACRAAEDAKKETLEALRAADEARRKAEEDRAAAIEASRAKSEFLANMSHELRTPLNAILGFSEMLASDTFDHKREEYATVIHSSGRHLLGLVNDLLDLSRIEANKVELHDEPIAMDEIIRSCAEVLEPRAVEAGIDVQCRVEQGLPLVNADRRAMLQIILNLLSNAVKFTPAGKRVEIFAQMDTDGGLAFGVRDEGAGIEEGEQARMFERFGQGRHDVTHARKGTGLGLPIVKGLAEAHGGRATMQSRLGQGTCVTVWLPPERLKKISAIAAA